MSVHEWGGYAWSYVPSGGWVCLVHPPEGTSQVLTSSGGDWSGRYAFYWNAFLSVNVIYILVPAGHIHNTVYDYFNNEWFIRCLIVFQWETNLWPLGPESNVQLSWLLRTVKHWFANIGQCNFSLPVIKNIPLWKLTVTRQHSSRIHTACLESIRVSLDVTPLGGGGGCVSP